MEREDSSISPTFISVLKGIRCIAFPEKKTLEDIDEWIDDVMLVLPNAETCYGVAFIGGIVDAVNEDASAEQLCKMFAKLKVQWELEGDKFKGYDDLVGHFVADEAAVLTIEFLLSLNPPTTDLSKMVQLFKPLTGPFEARAKACLTKCFGMVSGRPRKT